MEPAKLTKLVRGELDWIVMKALEKDRNRRYETANSFALDVQRYLADEPVQACPPSVTYRFRKLVRRNSRTLATLGLIAMIGLIAVVATAASIGWAVRDRRALEEDIARDRAARQASLEAEIDRALSEVNAFCEANKLAEADAAWTRANGLLAVGADSQQLRERVGRWRTLLDFGTRLEDIR